MKSTALLFGADTPSWLRRFLVACVALMGLAVLGAAIGRVNPLALVLALAGPWAMGWHMTWQLRQLDMQDHDRLLMLFRSNRDAGLLPLPFFAAALLL